MLSRRLLPAAMAALLLVCGAARAHADIIVLQDGKSVPRGSEVGQGQRPNDEQMDKYKDKRIETLGFDAIRLGGQDVAPGLVDALYPWDCETNSEFQSGETNASSGFFVDAAENFGRAAEELKGAGKQLALWKRVVSLAQLNDLDVLLPAIDAFVGEFPKAYFLADVLTRKARGLMSKNDLPGAQAALDAITAAPGMNKRDLHSAELTKLEMFQAAAAGRDRQKLAEAETAFRSRLSAIEGEGQAREEVAGARLRALVGIGRMLVFQGKQSDARPFLQQVIDAPEATAQVGMLASAYTALGHVMFAEARDTQAKAGGNEAEKKKAGEQLEAALLHYLRVTELYGDLAEGALHDARLSAARVFAAQFSLTNDTDCEAANLALRYYKAAQDMMPGGAERSSVVREGTEFSARRKKACEPKDPKEPK